MDLATLISDKKLLSTLTREYQLLKANNADINYEDWITRRLQFAAAAKGTAAQQQSAAAAQSALHAALAGRETTTQIARGAVNTTRHHQATQDHTKLQETNRHLHGASEPQPNQAAPHLHPQSVVQQEHRDEIVEQLQMPTTHVPTTEPTNQAESEFAPLWQPLGAIGNILPDGTHSEGASQPQWVAAAKLHRSLQASAVVPLMHAAADRDRKLAATAALARQQLAMDGGDVSDVNAWRQLYLDRLGQQQQQQQQVVVDDSNKERNGLTAALDNQQSQQPQVDVKTTSAGAYAPDTSQPQQQQQQPKPLPDVVKNSWLLRTVLQPLNSQAAATNNAPGGPSAPEFIRITGDSGNSSKLPTTVKQQQQQQQQPGSSSIDKRRQLRSALKQLLSSSSSTTEQQQQQQEAQGSSGMLLELLGEQQQQQQGVLDGQQQQLQQVVAQLQEVMQGLSSRASRDRGQQQQQYEDSHWLQDENSRPLDVSRHQRSPPYSCAKQQLLQRQQQRQQQQLQEATWDGVKGRHSPPRRPLQQQQQQQERGRPAWQSEVYVPPPVHLLKRKNAGYVDAWGVPIGKRLTTGRPASTDKVNHPSSKSANKATRANKHSRQQQQQQQQQQRRRIKQSQGDSRGHHLPSSWIQRGLSPVHEDVSHEQLFADDLLASAARLSSRSSGGWKESMPGNAVAAAGSLTTAGGAATRGAGFGDLSAEEVQEIEQQVQQQLLQDQQQAGASRLSRLEETSSHILSVLARLETQLQQPAAASQAATGASSSTLAAAAATPVTVAAGDDVPVQDPKVLSDLLSALDRMEVQEREIRDRWFAGQEAAAVPIVRQSAEVTHTSAVAETEGPLSPFNASLQLKADSGSAAVAAAPEQTAVGVPHQQQQQLQQQHPREVLSKEALKSIKSGRRRFLKHQAMVDGQLEVLDTENPSPALGLASSSRRKSVKKQQLQPRLVVEAVADLLLDELLLEQVVELDGFMEALCNQLFEEEFQEA